MPPAFESLADGELALDTRAGSLSAFEELVRRYEARVFRFTLSLCRNPEDAAETTQDIFVRAFQAIAQFDTKQEFLPWLFTIARRKCIDRFRLKICITDSEMPDCAGPDDPASLMSANEDRDSMWNLARHALPAIQYQALWLHYAEDLGIREIAQVLGKSGAHVKVLLFRARHTLGREIRRGARNNGELRPQGSQTLSESSDKPFPMRLSPRTAAPYDFEGNHSADT